MLSASIAASQSSPLGKTLRTQPNPIRSISLRANVRRDTDLALSYVRFASAINRMSGIAFFAHYGETSRIVGFFPEPADTVASRIFDLHRRHAANVCRVFEGVIRSHAASLREGSLPADCLLSLVLAQREDGDVYPAPNTVTEPAVNVGQNIRIAIDAKLRRVHFDRWGVIEGASATPIITLP